MSELRVRRRASSTHQRRPSSWWWRSVASIYVVVAAVCATIVLIYSVDYWQPCFAGSYDDPPCLAIQSHDVEGAFSYDMIGSVWLIALVAAFVTAVVGFRGRVPRSLVLLVPLLVLGANPLADYFLTPMVNGFYASYDAHPASGVPLGLGLAISGLVAASVALLPTRALRPLPQLRAPAA